MTNTNNKRRELMAERDRAIAAKDWNEMNRLTREIADLPLAGVPKLTAHDINRYATKKRS